MKGCSPIGDFNITEDFCQQFDQVAAYSKEFENKLNSSQTTSVPTQDVNLESGENIDSSVSYLTARENIEIILESLIKRDEKINTTTECKVISEDTLANNELRIENGQIHLEKTKTEDQTKFTLNAARFEYYKKEDVIKDEKIEIEYFNDGKLNKIYVPLDSSLDSSPAKIVQNFMVNNEQISSTGASEDLRQVSGKIELN